MSIQEYLLRKHLEAKQLQIERAAREAAERERREDEEKAAQERAAALAAMSEEQRMMKLLCERMEKGEDKDCGAGCLFAADIAKVADQALSWSDSDKARMAELLPELARHIGVNLKRQDKWKKRLRALKGT